MNSTLNTAQQELWNRINTFDIDNGPAAFPFAARLARDNAWHTSFAARVVAEYRKFVFLAMAAGHPVTPSDHVDQAWHLHLTYTRSYWERLCRDVLPRPLHHDPTRGGPAEQTKFNDWYSRTLESYTRLFGTLPPADIWPEPGVRFGSDTDCQRVNTRHNWIIPKAGARQSGLLALVLGAPLVVLAGCAPTLLVGGLSAAETAMVVLLIGVTIGVAVFASRRTEPGRSHARRRRGDASGGCGGLWYMGSSGTSSRTDAADSCDSPGDASGGCDAGAGGDGGGSGCGGGGCGGGGCGGGGD